jgi:hypothetical protein
VNNKEAQADPLGPDKHRICSISSRNASHSVATTSIFFSYTRKKEVSEGILQERY